MKTSDLVFEYIKQHEREKGYSPTIREIADAVGIKSPSTIHNHLERLERNGLIRRDGGSPRTIEVLEKSDDLVEIVKHNKGVPSVINWQGRRYVLDPKG